MWNSIPLEIKEAHTLSFVSEYLKWMKKKIIMFEFNLHRLKAYKYLLNITFISVCLWRVERVIILFCYFNCNSSIIYLYLLVLLLLLFLFYLYHFTTLILDYNKL